MQRKSSTKILKNSTVAHQPRYKAHNAQSDDRPNSIARRSRLGGYHAQLLDPSTEQLHLLSQPGILVPQIHLLPRHSNKVMGDVSDTPWDGLSDIGHFTFLEFYCSSTEARSVCSKWAVPKKKPASTREAGLPTHSLQRI
ncbi:MULTISPECIES: hypothetical protein [unclassified Rhizobium]|uniref:hypothetical protein n=1 Tax=unclassified Rhizobium TaxID=2613769 RepID=UPI0012E34A0A|nr:MULTISPECIES: hypothetical protein [unclassified Rhizobium]